MTTNNNPILLSAPQIITQTKASYWYKYIEYYCPQCGRSKYMKQRIYDTPKPQKAKDRYIIKEVYDSCDG